MAITVSTVGQPSPNPAVLSFASVALDNSYTTGGYALSPANFGFSSTIDFLFVNPSGGYVYEWVPSTGKLKMYRETASGTAALAEVANATDVSAVTALKIAAVGH